MNNIGVPHQGVSSTNTDMIMILLMLMMSNPGMMGPGSDNSMLFFMLIMMLGSGQNRMF